VLTHPRRGDLLARNRQLDPRTDYETINRTIMLLEFPWDSVTALNLAFYRVFAVPRMARLLVQTGEMEARPAKRAEDTGLILYEIITAGLQSERGLELIRRMNRMHRRWPIEDEDFRYVLAAFVVEPVRWIERYGWRPLDAIEVEAIARSYRELGRLMGIRDVPEDHAGIAALFDAYEQQHLAYSPEGARLLSATRGVIAERLPVGARFLAGPLLRAVLGPRLSLCLGVAPPGALRQASFRSALWVRGVILRRLPPRPTPWFTPGQRTTVYPDGYTVDDLGVSS
jgi:ER-bound oxygenase mpaB/B'/Rubber oxygenase, catalytic domain